MIAGATGVGRHAREAVVASTALLALMALVAVGGCQSPKEPSAGVVAVAPSEGGGNVEAKLVGTGGSSASGSATLHDAREGADISIWIGSLGPGEYRVAIHERGNCSSRNGFAAGAPWAPPGVPLAVLLFRKNDDTRTLTGYLPGYRVGGPAGMMGRAVIVHAGGSGSLEAQPDVPNNRIACGVIGSPEQLFPNLGL